MGIRGAKKSFTELRTLAQAAFVKLEALTSPNYQNLVFGGLLLCTSASLVVLVKLGGHIPKNVSANIR